MLYYHSLLLNLSMFILVSCGLAGLLLFVFYVLNRSKGNIAKVSAYECGFKAFSFTYSSFDVQFYQVGILFLLFDVEIIFLFPWAISFYQISAIGQFAVFSFIFLLFLGLIYELYQNVLNWGTFRY